MSGILGVFSGGGVRKPSRPLIADSAVREMLDRAGGRGNDRSAVHRTAGGLLAVARHEWEMAPGFSGDILVAQSRTVSAVADATLYYRADLLRRLDAAEVRPAGDTSTHLILAAYRAWRTDCARYLEGDFAFVVRDRLRGSVFAARDFGGKRPLFYAEIDGGVAIASTLGALLQHPRCSSDLNLAAVAEDAAALTGSLHETCYLAIRRLPAGWSLCWSPGERVRVFRHREPPSAEPVARASMEEGAEELRSLLSAAVAERLDRERPTAISLSGGRDSSAVFAVAQSLARAGMAAAAPRAVSVSFPPGDRGREDELISSIVSHWDTATRWLDIDGIPLLRDGSAEAAERDEPFAHAFESFNRALGRESRRLGAHVLLDGHGGDGLFSVSTIYMSDLFRSGRWVKLMREWRARRGGSGFRAFFRWAIQPVLPAPALSLATALRGGRPLRGHLEQRVPDWFDEDFVHRFDLRERQRLHMPPRPQGRSWTAHELRLAMSLPLVSRVISALAAIGLGQGVELRSPLADRRIVEFAARRPRAERATGKENKLLLRRAMDGLLPPDVLKFRPRRTGVTSDYFGRATRRIHAEAIDEAFRNPVLAELGMVNAQRLRQRWQEYLRTGADDLGYRLYMTFQCEVWLRTHGVHSGGGTDSTARAGSEPELLSR